MPQVVVFPFHQDQPLGVDIQLPDGITSTRVDPPLPAGDRWDRLVVLLDRLAHAVAADLETAGQVVVVSSDCVAALGTLAGVQRAGLDPSLVWFDAHGDLHTTRTSTSGYLGGMALRMAMGGDAGLVGDRLGLRPLDEERVILVDARDLDPAEADHLASSRIRVRSVDRVEVDDLPDGPVILHVDLDVVDAAAVPGVRYPVAGGPSRASVVAAVRRLRADGRVVALHLTYPWLEPPASGEEHLRRDLLAELLSP